MHDGSSIRRADIRAKDNRVMLKHLHWHVQRANNGYVERNFTPYPVDHAVFPVNDADICAQDFNTLYAICPDVLDAFRTEVFHFLPQRLSPRPAYVYPVTASSYQVGLLQHRDNQSHLASAEYQ